MAGNWLDGETATWVECRDFLSHYPCAILPLGATEQHGPHLPQNTDTLIAHALARAVAQRSAGLVLPPLPFGYSWVWRHYPGTITLSLETFRAVVKDIAKSLNRNGCQALLLLTTHGANVQPLKYAVREIADEAALKMLHLFYPDLPDILSDADSPMWQPMNFHADEFETSLMLYLRPGLVQMDKAVREYPSPSLDYAHSSLEMGALSRSGVFGDPTVATGEKGRRWFHACAERIATLWKDFLCRHFPHPFDTLFKGGK